MDRAPRNSAAKAAGIVCTLILAVAACDSPATAPALEDAAAAVPDAAAAAPSARSDAHTSLGVDPGLGARIAALREATARYHRIEAALADGYTVLVRHPETGAACLESEAGGMGRHMLNPALAGDDVVTIAKPEALIYEPTKNGRLRLVGVEYVVPYAIRGVDEAPPELFGQAFHQNATFGLWALHVYAWKHNPDGLFAAWNPTISCEHDGP